MTTVPSKCITNHTTSRISVSAIKKGGNELLHCKIKHYQYWRKLRLTYLLVIYVFPCKIRRSFNGKLKNKIIEPNQPLLSYVGYSYIVLIQTIRQSWTKAITFLGLTKKDSALSRFLQYYKSSATTRLRYLMAT